MESKEPIETALNLFGDLVGQLKAVRKTSV